VPIAWRDVILGAIITAVLFVAGKWVIGLYLSQTNFSSGYGAAGSLVLLVSWIFYSAQIFFYGALFTHEHAIRSGRVARASSSAPVSATASLPLSNQTAE
jgi:membrane protein